jgi:hypothetical protein
MRQRLFRVLIVLWGGSLWSLAAWVALTVFHMLGDPRLAGPIAARLFGIETYLGLAVAAAALALPARRRLGALYAAVGLLLVNEWALRPFMSAALADGAARGLPFAQGRSLGLTFAAWHGVSTAVYVAACACVLCLVWREPYRDGGLPRDSGLPRKK